MPPRRPLQVDRQSPIILPHHRHDGRHPRSAHGEGHVLQHEGRLGGGAGAGDGGEEGVEELEGGEVADGGTHDPGDGDGGGVEVGCGGVNAVLGGGEDGGGGLEKRRGVRRR